MGVAALRIEFFPNPGSEYKGTHRYENNSPSCIIRLQDRYPTVPRNGGVYEHTWSESRLIGTDPHAIF